MSKTSGKPYLLLRGTGTLAYKKFIPKNVYFRSNIARYITSKPRYLGGQGYYYADNSQNRQTLGKLEQCVRNINARHAGKRVSRGEAPYLSNPGAKEGIIGWDIQCELPEWVEAVTKRKTKWNVKLQPQRKKGTIYFSKNAVSHKAVVKSIHHLQTKDTTHNWYSIYPTAIDVITNKKFDNQFWEFKAGTKAKVCKSYEASALRAFLESNATTMFISWTGHARFVMKDTQKPKTLLLYDSWMSHVDRGGRKGNRGFKKLQNYISRDGWTLKFVNRKINDQGSEGSCSVQAFMRILMVTLNNGSGALGTVDNYVIVLAFRLISMFR